MLTVVIPIPVGRLGKSCLLSRVPPCGWHFKGGTFSLDSAKLRGELKCNAPGKTIVISAYSVSAAMSWQWIYQRLDIGHRPVSPLG